ncbi:MAG TPA: phospholipid carrier-dependent glycosyltransferase [Anaerolineae bacterium]|nr:phospholipid carrier-dependent glycosyltransferase [Anaerolineae bacterium]
MSVHSKFIRRNTLSRWALGILLIIFVVWEANHLEGFSWGYDEGLYLIVARLVRSGYTLYKEVSHSQGPLFIYSVVSAFELFGMSVAAGRFVIVLYAAIGLLAVALTAQHLNGWASGLSAAVLLMLAPEFFRLSRAVMPDVPVSTMATLAIMSSLRYLRTGHRKWLLFAGFAFGIGCLFKLIIIPAFLPIGLAVLCFHPSTERLRAWRKLASDTALVLGAALIPGLICLLVYGWQPLYDHLVAPTVRARAAFPLDTAANARWIGEYLLDNAGLTILAIWGALLLLPRRSASVAVIASWGAVVLLALVFQTPLFFHHMGTLLFPMSVLGGCVAGDLEERLRSPWKPITWRKGIILLIGLGAVAGYVFTLPTTLKDYRTLLVAPTTSRQTDATRFISTFTWPDDWIVSDDPSVAFRADRNVPPPLTDPSIRVIAAGCLTDEHLIASTEEYQPQAVVYLSGRFTLLPRYLEWVREHYRLAKSYDETAQIYYPRKITPPLPIQHPQQATLGQGIRFLGYDLHHSPFKPGGQVYLTLYWQALDKIDDDYTVFTHLLDSEGRLQAQKDNPPVHGLLPTSAWEVGEIIQDRYIIPLPPDLPPGDYQIEVGMYQLETGQRLEVRGEPEGEGDRILLGEVEVSD